MTIVIGVINKSAVAIAADNAVSLSLPDNRKVLYADKRIFSLSAKRSVGLIIYNQHEFMDEPWEELVERYRSVLGDKGFGTLMEYKEDFIQFLREQHFFYDMGQQKKVLTRFVTGFVRDAIEEVIHKYADLLLDCPEKLHDFIPGRIIPHLEEKRDAYLSNTSYCDDFRDFTREEYDQLGDFGLNGIIHEIVVEYEIPIDIDKFTQVLNDCIYHALKSKDLRDCDSGLVFTGYGEDEIYPGKIAVDIAFLVNNRLRYCTDENNTSFLDEDNSGALMIFSRKTVIDRLLHVGGDGPPSDGVLGMFAIRNSYEIAQLVAPMFPHLARHLREISRRYLTGELTTVQDDAQLLRYVRAVLAAVSTLPREELAPIAEGLIYLTYLARGLSPEKEYAEGTIDVAIITKENGFMWVKQQHFFSAELIIEQFF